MARAHIIVINRTHIYLIIIYSYYMVLKYCIKIGHYAVFLLLSSSHIQPPSLVCSFLELPFRFIAQFAAWKSHTLNETVGMVVLQCPNEVSFPRSYTTCAAIFG